MNFKETAVTAVLTTIILGIAAFLIAMFLGFLLAKFNLNYSNIGGLLLTASIYPIWRFSQKVARDIFNKDKN